MTCGEFRRRWDELLDAEAGGPRSIGEVEAALLAHAADCPACRPIAARYQALRHAIRAWRNPPAPPAGLVHRILAVPVDPTQRMGGSPARRARRTWADHHARIRPIAGLAATVLIGMLLATSFPRLQPAFRADRREVMAPAAVVEAHPIAAPREPAPGLPAFDRALAEATSATWDLARTASEPAARIGREMLDATSTPDEGGGTRPVDPSAGLADDGLVGLSVPVPSLGRLASEAAEASIVLQEVGDQLSAGVRPLSSTARHAFGFLLGPPPAHAGSPPAGSNSNGARSG